MSKIVMTKYRELVSLFEKATRQRDTMEIINARFDLEYNTVDFDKQLEIESVVGLFGLEKYNRIYKIEEHHYKMFKETLLHKLQEIKYYFGESLGDTRKCLAFSTDCISMINIIQRKDKLIAFLHMRSSDYDNLLPMDLLHVSSVLKDIADEYAINNIIIHVSVASLHKYLKNRYRR